MGQKCTQEQKPIEGGSISLDQAEARSLQRLQLKQEQEDPDDCKNMQYITISRYQDKECSQTLIEVQDGQKTRNHVFLSPKTSKTTDSLIDRETRDDRESDRYDSQSGPQLIGRRFKNPADKLGRHDSNASLTLCEKKFPDDIMGYGVPSKDKMYWTQRRKSFGQSQMQVEKRKSPKSDLSSDIDDINCYEKLDILSLNSDDVHEEGTVNTMVHTDQTSVKMQSSPRNYSYDNSSYQLNTESPREYDEDSETEPQLNIFENLLLDARYLINNDMNMEMERSIKTQQSNQNFEDQFDLTFKPKYSQDHDVTFGELGNETSMNEMTAMSMSLEMDYLASGLPNSLRSSTINMNKDESLWAYNNSVSLNRLCGQKHVLLKEPSAHEKNMSRTSTKSTIRTDNAEDSTIKQQEEDFSYDVLMEMVAVGQKQEEEQRLFKSQLHKLILLRQQVFLNGIRELQNKCDRAASQHF